MKARSLFVLFSGIVLASACASGDGSGGSSAQDCDGHGVAHNGHCHCDDGYLFDGATCVGPSEIVQTCEEHEAPDGGDDDGGDTHVHGAACRCPTTGTCPCEHGEVQVLAGSTYCVPHLDE